MKYYLPSSEQVCQRTAMLLFVGASLLTAFDINARVSGQMVDICAESHQIISSKSVTISSPGYPSNYGSQNDVTCRCRITSMQGDRIKIEATETTFTSVFRWGCWSWIELISKTSNSETPTNGTTFCLPYRSRNVTLYSVPSAQWTEITLRVNGVSNTDRGKFKFSVKVRNSTFMMVSCSNGSTTTTSPVTIATSTAETTSRGGSSSATSSEISDVSNSISTDRHDETSGAEEDFNNTTTSMPIPANSSKGTLIGVLVGILFLVLLLIAAASAMLILKFRKRQQANDHVTGGHRVQNGIDSPPSSMTLSHLIDRDGSESRYTADPNDQRNGVTPAIQGASPASKPTPASGTYSASNGNAHRTATDSKPPGPVRQKSDYTTMDQKSPRQGSVKPSLSPTVYADLEQIRSFHDVAASANRTSEQAEVTSTTENDLLYYNTAGGLAMTENGAEPNLYETCYSPEIREGALASDPFDDNFYSNVNRRCDSGIYSVPAATGDSLKDQSIYSVPAATGDPLKDQQSIYSVPAATTDSHKCQQDQMYCNAVTATEAARKYSENNVMLYENELYAAKK